MKMLDKRPPADPIHRRLWLMGFDEAECALVGELAGALEARKTYEVHIQNCSRCLVGVYCQREIELDIDWMEKRDAALAKAHGERLTQ
jgi:hypothetical protein